MAVRAPTSRAVDRARESAIARELEPRIRYVVARRLPADWADLIDDIVHEVLAAVIEAVREERLRKSNSLHAFARAAARNVASNWRRREMRRKTLPLDDSFPMETASALELLVREERAAEVAECLRKLRPQDREILRLAYFEGKAPAEIATILGVEPKTVRRWKSRAQDRFRRFWKKLNDL